MHINVADNSHPITTGIDDFEITDETYKNKLFAEDNHLLLTTDHPNNDSYIGWTRNYGRGRVCYLQLGHGPNAYGDENFRKLVSQAIRWCARRNISTGAESE